MPAHRSRGKAAARSSRVARLAGTARPMGGWASVTRSRHTHATRASASPRVAWRSRRRALSQRITAYTASSTRIGKHQTEHQDLHPQRPIARSKGSLLLRQVGGVLAWSGPCSTDGGWVPAGGTCADLLLLGLELLLVGLLVAVGHEGRRTASPRWISTQACTSLTLMAPSPSGVAPMTTGEGCPALADGASVAAARRCRRELGGNRQSGWSAPGRARGGRPSRSSSRVPAVGVGAIAHHVLRDRGEFLHVFAGVLRSRVDLVASRKVVSCGAEHHRRHPTPWAARGAVCGKDGAHR